MRNGEQLMTPADYICLINIETMDNAKEGKLGHKAVQLLYPKQRLWQRQARRYEKYTILKYLILV